MTTKQANAYRSAQLTHNRALYLPNGMCHAEFVSVTYVKTDLLTHERLFECTNARNVRAVVPESHLNYLQ